MNLGKWDMVLGISMTLAIIAMSFTFPALGLTGSNQNASDIPDLSIDTNAFEVTRSRPEYPSSPSHGTLNHSSDQFDDYRGSIQTEVGHTSGGEDLYIVAIDEDKVHIINESTIIEAVTFNQTGKIKVLSGGGFTFDVIAKDFTHGVFEWQATERPEDNAWYSSIPLMGGLFSASEQLAGVVGWIAATFIWASTAIVLGAINVINIVFQVTVFGLSLVMWLINTYASITSGAPNAWASVFVAIPGVILSYLLMKIGIIGIRTVPFT